MELIHYVALSGMGPGSPVEVRLHYRAWEGEEGAREGGTLKRLNGQASEMEVVHEGADQDKVQSFGWGLRTIGPSQK